MPWQLWREILSRAFQAFLKGRGLPAPPRSCPNLRNRRLNRPRLHEVSTI